MSLPASSSLVLRKATWSATVLLFTVCIINARSSFQTTDLFLRVSQRVSCVRTEAPTARKKRVPFCVSCLFGCVCLFLRHDSVIVCV